MKSMRITKVVASAALALLAGPALAYPDKPVRIILPYPAGGGADAAIRIVAARLQELWKQPVVVENRPGAQGAIGTEAMLKERADGYTLLSQVPIMLSTELVRPSVRYRTLRDFTAVTVVFTTPIVYMASASAPPGDIKAVLEAGKGQRPALDYASHGAGSSTNFLGERLKKTSGVDMTHIPYAGDGPMLSDLLGGHLKTGFLSAASAKKALATGKVRALAVASPQRSPLLPDVPTFAEAGIRGMDRESWQVLFAPAGTPKAIVDQLARDVGTVLEMPAVRKQYDDMAVNAKGGTPAETQKLVVNDYRYIESLVKEFGDLSK